MVAVKNSSKIIDDDQLLKKERRKIRRLRGKMQEVRERCDEDIALMRSKKRRINSRNDNDIRIKTLCREITLKTSPSYRLGNVLVLSFSRISWRLLFWPVLLVKEVFNIYLEKMIRS